jgi:hypothetical protein
MQLRAWVVVAVALASACSEDPEPGAASGDGGKSDASQPDAGFAGNAGAAGSNGGLDAAPDADPPPTNRYGIPETTFTIPPGTHASGAFSIYAPDVQETWPEVDWANLDRLYIPGGEYAFVRLGNLPARNPERPLVITNKDGQVRIGAKDHNYLMSLTGGTSWILTGWYDPISLTGDVGYPGHAGGAYANSRDRYGILVDDQFVRKSVSGIAVGGRASDFTIEFVEVRHVGFAGMLIKTDDVGDATMRNVVLRDLYIHDVRSEGIYFGSTQPQPQHTLVDFEITNNRILRAGTETLQVGQVAGGRIHHNVLGLGALDWRWAFQQYQDGNLQMGAVRGGLLEVDHNVIIGAAGTLFNLFPAVVPGDTHAAGDGVYIHDNYIANGSSLTAYVANVDDGFSSYRIERNFIGANLFRNHEVYPTATEPAEMLRIANDARPVTLTDNRFAGTRKLSNKVDLNGTNGNLTASGNVNGDVTPITFLSFLGLEVGFDYRRLEGWTATATLAPGTTKPPVVYEPGDHVMHLGKFYRCLATNSETEPPAAGIWEELPLPPDDVRISAGSPYAGYGIE